MERKIDNFLLEWKTDILKRPLIIYGPHQVGKTYSVIKFGKENFKNIIYLNAYKNKELEDIFKSRNIEKIINQLEVLSLDTILEKDTLIIIDNLDSVEIVKGLKAISILKTNYNFIGITSHSSNIKLFKGEELNFKKMLALDFEEYLWSIGEKALASTIRESFQTTRKCSFHKLAMEYFEDYIITGGMPEVIQAKNQKVLNCELDSIKQKIIDIYEKELLTLDKINDIKKAVLAFDSIPMQLLKDNKKFLYDLADPKSRKSEYVNGIEKLNEIGLTCTSKRLKKIESPLSKCKDEDSMKLYVQDTGLLFTMMKLTYRKFSVDEKAKEILYENYVAATLTNLGYTIYYYTTESRVGKIHFVIQTRTGQIIPIEISIKEKARSKMMAMFIKKNQTTRAYKVTEDNFQTKKETRYVPIYSMFCFNA